MRLCLRTLIYQKINVRVRFGKVPILEIWVRWSTTSPLMNWDDFHLLFVKNSYRFFCWHCEALIFLILLWTRKFYLCLTFWFFFGFFYLMFLLIFLLLFLFFLSAKKVLVGIVQIMWFWFFFFFVGFFLLFCLIFSFDLNKKVLS